MKFTCPKNDLKRILNSLHLVSAKTLQEKPFILIETSVKDQAVRFRSANRSLRARATLKDGVIVESRGSRCAVSQFLLDAASSMQLSSSEEVCLCINDSGNLHISSVDKDAEYELGLFGPENLPRYDDKNVINKLEIKCEEFKDLISRTLFSCAREYPMEFVLKDNKMKCVGISTVRIAMDAIGIDSDIEDRITLGRDSVDLMHRLANSKTGSMLFGWSDDTVSIKCDEFILTAPTVRMPIPDYEQIMSVLSGNDKVAKISMNELRRKLNPFLSFADPRSATIKLKFGKNVIEAELDNVKAGKAKWDIACEYENEEITLQFNIKYLHEFARNLISGDLLFRMKDSKTPVLIEGIDTDIKYMVSQIWFGE